MFNTRCNEEPLYAITYMTSLPSRLMDIYVHPSPFHPKFEGDNVVVKSEYHLIYSYLDITNSVLKLKMLSMKEQKAEETKAVAATSHCSKITRINHLFKISV